MKTTLLLLLVSVLGISPADARHHRRPSRKSPHQEVTASARVATSPRRTTHANRREFEEFDVVVLSAAAAPEGDHDPDTSLAIDRTSSVHVVHDLTCGGTWIDLRPGDVVDLKGEYVQPGNGRDLIHFTHPSGGACGGGETHPDGWLKRRSGP
jgi:hypothetical protein